MLRFATADALAKSPLCLFETLVGKASFTNYKSVNYFNDKLGVIAGL